MSSEGKVIPKGSVEIWDNDSAGAVEDNGGKGEDDDEDEDMVVGWSIFLLMDSNSDLYSCF